MFLKKLNKIPYLRARLLALVCILLGSVFIFSFFYSGNKLPSYDVQIQKWTNLSNYMAFFVSLLYFCIPKSKIFKYNTLILFGGNCLFFAGIGFWLILFPTVFIGLPDYVMRFSEVSKSSSAKLFNYFAYVWNHLVTQLGYFVFMIFSFKESSKNHLIPIRLRTINLFLLIWLSIYVIVFVIIFPFVTNYFPVYGIFTNFNWKTKFRLLDGQLLFSWKIATFTVISFYLFAFLTSFLNWRTSIQFNKMSSDKYLQKI